MAVLLEVVVDFGDAHHAGILVALVLSTGVALLVPVEDASHEGGNQLDARIGRGNCLGEPEEQGHVAVDLFLLQRLGGLKALPGARDFDQHAIATYAGVLLHLYYALRAVDGALLVEAESGVDFRGNLARNELEDLAAEVHRKFVGD